MAASNKMDRSLLRRLSSSMQGSHLDRARDLAPWVALCVALGVVCSGLWLREQDEQQHAPLRRTEVQVQNLKALQEGGWSQWIGGEIVASSSVEKVADAWVALTKEHPGLPSVAPARLAQVDGGRVVVQYRNEASADEVTAHAESAADQPGVVQVWTDQKGFEAWAQQAAIKRQSSVVLAILALGLFGFGCKSLWRRQWDHSRAWRTSMVQLGLSASIIERRLRRILGFRVICSGAAAMLLVFPLHSFLQTTQQMDGSELEKSAAFRPRKMEIPLASDFPCKGACVKDAELSREHSYLVEHKLGVLARQDRALDRHERALRPWLWGLSRTPSTLAQRTVLGANLVNPELETRFSAWDIEDKAFHESLREVEALAKRMQAKQESRALAKGTRRMAPDKQQGSTPLDACDAGQAPWAKKSLKSWVASGSILPLDEREKVSGLQEPGLRIKAKQGAKVKSSVGAEVAAILRDTPGRFTLVLDSGQSWIWALGGIAALEVHTGDRVQPGEVLGEVARPGPHDEGVSALLVELWQGSRQADPRGCFEGSSKRGASSGKSLGRSRSSRYNARR